MKLSLIVGLIFMLTACHPIPGQEPIFAGSWGEILTGAVLSGVFVGRFWSMLSLRR